MTAAIPARLPVLAVSLVLAGAAAAGWMLLRPKALPPGFAAGNGRIEAVEIDIAAKSPGRLLEVLQRGAGPEVV